MGHQPGLVFRLLFRGKAAVDQVVIHVRVSFDCGEGGLERAHESSVTLDLLHQPLAMSAKGSYTVEVGRTQYLTDLLQRKSQFPVEENLLQAEELVAAVVAISIRTHACALTTAQLVQLVRRPDATPAQPRRIS